MRQFEFSVALMAVLIALTHVAEAGQITYAIQDYPADQQGATLSGTITTDGVIGNLATTDIQSWSWTVTPSSGVPFTLSSSDIGASVEIGGSVVASQSSITIASPPSINNILGFGIFNAGHVVELFYEQGVGGSFYSAEDQGGPGGRFWSTFNPQMGGTDPWVIAVAASAVPEPSSVLLLSAGIAGLLFARRVGRSLQHVR